MTPSLINAYSSLPRPTLNHIRSIPALANFPLPPFSHPCCVKQLGFYIRGLYLDLKKRRTQTNLRNANLNFIHQSTISQ